MIDVVKVDFQATFGGGLFLGVEPKPARIEEGNGSFAQQATRQAVGKDDGLPRWVATIAVKVLNRFPGRPPRTEVLNVTMSSEKQPCADIPMGTPVTIEGLEMGVMASNKNGFTTFFSCDAIKPVRVGSAQRSAIPSD